MKSYLLVGLDRIVSIWIVDNVQPASKWRPQDCLGLACRGAAAVPVVEKANRLWLAPAVVGLTY
jgi:hypothetical protein